MGLLSNYQLCECGEVFRQYFCKKCDAYQKNKCKDCHEEHFNEIRRMKDLSRLKRRLGA
jgi:hypothetical protein